MTEVTHAMEAAKRCLQAALEHTELGDFRTAASLFRATARYVAGLDEEERTTGEVVAFPVVHQRFTRAGEPLAQMLGW